MNPSIKLKVFCIELNLASLLHCSSCRTLSPTSPPASCAGRPRATTTAPTRAPSSTSSSSARRRPPTGARSSPSSSGTSPTVSSSPASCAASIRTTGPSWPRRQRSVLTLTVGSRTTPHREQFPTD